MQSLHRIIAGVLACETVNGMKFVPTTAETVCVTTLAFSEAGRNSVEKGVFWLLFADQGKKLLAIRRNLMSSIKVKKDSSLRSE